MIDIKPSPVQPKFSFSEYDGIVIGGQVIPLRAEQTPHRKITATQAKPPDGLAI